jgi:transcription initiation factor IIE alpha subunit
VSTFAPCGVSALAQTVRDLACIARLLTPVLVALAEWGGATTTSEIARRCEATDRDVRMALFLLEEQGLIESRSFAITEEGRRALKT